MELRRVKIKQLLDKVPKIIFRLSQVVSKKVKVEVEGEDVEIDRSMLAILEDPFVHILRNSMDHGFETPQERIESGKDEEGVFLIKVWTEQNMVRINIEDDGRGINGDIVAEKALEKGTITEAQVAAMSFQQKQELIFMPGFSTRDAATEISGRGVGMDVVRSKILQAGGSVGIVSELGKGTSLTIALPIAATLSTRAILRLRTGTSWFSVPMDKVEYISCIQSREKVLTSSGALELFPYRGSNIPVVNLRRFLTMEAEQEQEFRSFIVLQEQGSTMALEVDEFTEFETHVMQEFLPGHFEVTPFEGASVMGDGSICLLLSLEKILEREGLNIGEASLSADIAPGSEKKGKLELGSILVVQPGDEPVQFSMEMSSVVRIESFQSDLCKRIKGKRIYKSNMGLLQYFELWECGLGVEPREAQSMEIVILLRLGSRVVALGVNSIIDMITERPKFIGGLNLPCVKDIWDSGSHLVGMLDLDAVRDAFHPTSSDRGLLVEA